MPSYEHEAELAALLDERLEMTGKKYPSWRRWRPGQ